MEREFFTDNFENLLKENADQFKMSPSKKVWHGIYNDLHPGRRWPSALMSLIFIFTLVIVGHLNTQQNQHSYLTNLPKNPEQQKDFRQQNNTTVKSTDKQVNKIAIKNTVKPTFQTEDKSTARLSENSLPISKDESINNNNKTHSQTAVTTIREENRNLALRNKIADLNLNMVTAPVTAKGLSGNLNESKSFSDVSINDNSPVTNNELIKNDDRGKNNLSHIKNNKVINIPAKNQTTHVPLWKIRRNSKIRWTYYLSPVVSYRTYSKQNANIFNSAVSHHPSPGLEAGTMMKYSLTKRLRFISGLQANYSSYSVQANNIHPVMATLLLYNNERMAHQISSISFYGNGPGAAPVNLRNYSLQLSVPVGFEYKLAGNDDVQLNAAATFQPVFVVANRAYILSTDKKNYITQASLSHKWNMSTNLGTYVSFNSNKFNWQIGPQVHYQLFSSYSSAYPVREHFINYGVRLGVSKIVR